jgi:hypothetical protein
MPATQSAKAATFEPVTALSTNLTAAQERNAATMARAYDAWAKTAQAIWDSEPELFRLETDQLLKAFSPPQPGDNPVRTLTAQCAQLHDNADRVIAQMRHINDLAWNCGWTIAAIYAEGMQDIWSQAQTTAQGTALAVAQPARATAA